MGKLWGQRTLPVKTRLSRLHIALTMATLSMAGAADAVYADEAILDGDRHISHSVSYDGKVIVGAVDVSHLLIDGGTFSADQLVIGSKGQSQARVRVSNGAKLVNDEATIAYGVDDTQYEQRPQAVISGQGSEWRVNNKLAVAGVLDVLGGAKVSAGALAIASQPWEGKKAADIYVGGAGSHLHVDGRAEIESLSLADGGRFSTDSKKLYASGLLVIGSRGSFNGSDKYSYDLNIGTDLTLGQAQAPGVLDSDIVIDTGTDGMSSYWANGVVFNHTSNDYELANVISGYGSLVNVSGQTTLTGDLRDFIGHVIVKGGKLTVNSDMALGYEDEWLIRYQELSVENGGTLVLNGTMGFLGTRGTGFSSHVFVRPGGVLAGDATVGRTRVEQGGHISPGDGGIGKFTIKGDAIFNDGAFYDVDIAADGRSDSVAVADKTTIGKDVKVLVNALDPHTSYQNGQSYRIWTTNKGYEGMFSEAVLDSAFLDASLTNDEKYVDLTIRQKNADGNTGGDDGNHDGGNHNGDSHAGGGDGDSHNGGGNDGHTDGSPNAPGIFQTVATNDNQWNTAGALSSLAQLGPSLGLYNSLLMLNATQAREAFNQLSGEQYASVQSSLLQSGTLVGNVVNQHMQTMFDDDSLTVPPLAMSLVQGAERERSGAWGQVFGNWTRSKGDSNVGKLDSNTGGFLVGADRELSEGVRAGAYAGYSRTHFDVDSRASSGHSNNYHLGLYGAGQRDALALRGGLGYSWHRIESERNVGFGGYRDRLTGGYDGNTLQAFTELGYRLRYESASVEPFVNLSYVRLHTDAVQEQGGAAALSVKDETMNTFYSTLGLRGATDIPVSGVDVTLHGNLGWQHAYGDTDTSAQMAFATGDSFATKGAPVDKDVAVVGVGLDVPLTRSTRVGVSYQGQYGSQLQANSVNAQLTVTF
ncbi:Extracellular serine protease precursor [Serratia ficaria]|uniref:autotransporter outer membrane beta-barrel domain-containing protein n=1 Tax=Serratia ficaria TaxID=61651 RepID=UPI00217C1BBF|nr:autotransporter outer membrane beta-barrel domain-containing protein [Serratia ficaria]CAI1160569.1 Extracellular serine protease precursor [Serratia ficaria]CAI1897187.1 Extracellular serine protease precursor [Serratia ficaria]CAI2500744.1 Extracellular serine protease precursor [Serratia ficaria]CAI2523851.1 Extracellular serine protease precursor [Serratia ficaria]CAI2793322.1 Extracellular serine protease precursor [Serratia ficaria]